MTSGKLAAMRARRSFGAGPALTSRTASISMFRGGDNEYVIWGAQGRGAMPALGKSTNLSCCRRISGPAAREDGRCAPPSVIYHRGKRSLSVSSQTAQEPSQAQEGGDNGRHQKDDLSSSTATKAPSLSILETISMDELLKLSSSQPTALSLANMYQYAPKRSNGKSSRTSDPDGQKFVDVGRLRNAQFLHRELEVRVAQRAVDLLTLPHGLNRTREVQSVANTFLRYLQRLRDFPLPTNAESERAFTAVLESFVLDRHSIPMAIARGLQSLKDGRKAPADARRLEEMEEALVRFFTARVGLRFLVEHHILSGNDENSDALYRRQLAAEGGLDLLEDEDSGSSFKDGEDCCGAIQKDCDPVREVKRTVARVTRLCRESYGIAPEIKIVDCTPDGDATVPFTYVPHHLRYMLAELLKNSCRATVRR
ncbi:hypothetical protein ACHAWF_004578 [Thalassiosira exigua]